jgi:hypothetical protein
MPSARTCSAWAIHDPEALPYTGQVGGFDFNEALLDRPDFAIVFEVELGGGDEGGDQPAGQQGQQNQPFREALSAVRVDGLHHGLP